MSSSLSGSIPASQIVNVIPSVLNAGGNGLDLNGVLLTTSGRVPIGQAMSFATAEDVEAYFGPTSPEAANASIYFGGFEGADQLPGQIIFAQYPAAAVGAWLRGGNISSMSLAALQALTGTLSLSVGGTTETSSTISLSTATSFSQAASLIEAAFTSPGFTVTFDSVSGAFLVSNTATGAASTLTYATGTLAASLLLTQATGATLSQGAAAATPGPFMDGLVKATQNWAGFATIFDPDGGTGNAQKLAFAQWVGQQNNRYFYAAWDGDVTATQNGTTTHLGALLKAAGLSGTIPIYDPGNTVGLAAFALGWAASLDFTETNGRATLAFKSQSGLEATVADATIAQNLIANGYNFYGAYATANQAFLWFYPGQISGEYEWADSYVNQIWMNNAFQLAEMELLAAVKSIPYNAVGYAMIQGALYAGAGTASSGLAGEDANPAGPIQQALAFGAIQPGTTLSAVQIQAVNSDAGKSIAATLQNRGWYLQVLDPGAQARGARTTPVCKFWYCDGGSVQQITLSSVEVQ